MTCLPERQQVVVLLTEAMLAGARQKRACAVLGLSTRTVQRWLDADAVREDQRPVRRFEPANKLGSEERRQLLAVANGTEFGPLPPSQIVPRLADPRRVHCIGVDLLSRAAGGKSTGASSR